MSVHDREFHASIKAHRPWTVRETRYSVGADATISTSDGRFAPAVVRNLSNNGCRITTALELRNGECVSFVVEPLGRVEAEVRWTDEEGAGLKLVGRDPFYGDYRLSYLP